MVKTAGYPWLNSVNHGKNGWLTMVELARNLSLSPGSLLLSKPSLHAGLSSHRRISLPPYICRRTDVGFDDFNFLEAKVWIPNERLEHCVVGRYRMGSR